MPVVNPKVPEGLRELLKGLTKEVLREKPSNIYEFSAYYFESLLKESKDVLARTPEIFTNYERAWQARERSQIPVALVFKIVPDALTKLIKDFIKALLKRQPENIYEFAVEYFRRQKQSENLRGSEVEYTAYQNYFKSKDRFTYTPYFKCACGRTIGAGFSQELDAHTEFRGQTKDDSSRNADTEDKKCLGPELKIIDKNALDKNTVNEVGLPSRREQSHAESELKKKDSLVDNATNEAYFSAVCVIQRFFKRYIKEKRARTTEVAVGAAVSEGSKMTQAVAALIIQRKLRSVRCHKKSSKARTAEGIKLRGENDDNVSEAAVALASNVPISAELPCYITERDNSDIGIMLSEKQDNQSQPAVDSATSSGVLNDSAKSEVKGNDLPVEQGIRKNTVKTIKSQQNDSDENREDSDKIRVEKEEKIGKIAEASTILDQYSGIQENLEQNIERNVSYDSTQEPHNNSTNRESRMIDHEEQCKKTEQSQFEGIKDSSAANNGVEELEPAFAHGIPSNYEDSRYEDQNVRNKSHEVGASLKFSTNNQARTGTGRHDSDLEDSNKKLTNLKADQSSESQLRRLREEEKVLNVTSLEPEMLADYSLDTMETSRPDVIQDKSKEDEREAVIPGEFKKSEGENKEFILISQKEFEISRTTESEKVEIYKSASLNVNEKSKEAEIRKDGDDNTEKMADNLTVPSKKIPHDGNTTTETVCDKSSAPATPETKDVPLRKDPRETKEEHVANLESFKATNLTKINQIPEESTTEIIFNTSSEETQEAKKKLRGDTKVSISSNQVVDELSMSNNPSSDSDTDKMNLENGHEDAYGLETQATKQIAGMQVDKRNCSADPNIQCKKARKIDEENKLDVIVAAVMTAKKIMAPIDVNKEESIKNTSREHKIFKDLCNEGSLVTETYELGNEPTNTPQSQNECGIPGDPKILKSNESDDIQILYETGTGRQNPNKHQALEVSKDLENSQYGVIQKDTETKENIKVGAKNVEETETETKQQTEKITGEIESTKDESIFKVENKAALEMNPSKSETHAIDILLESNKVKNKESLKKDVEEPSEGETLKDISTNDLKENLSLVNESKDEGPSAAKTTDSIRCSVALEAKNSPALQSYETGTIPEEYVSKDAIAPNISSHLDGSKIITADDIIQDLVSVVSVKTADDEEVSENLDSGSKSKESSETSLTVQQEQPNCGVLEESSNTLFFPERVAKEVQPNCRKNSKQTHLLDRVDAKVIREEVESITKPDGLWSENERTATYLYGIHTPRRITTPERKIIEKEGKYSENIPTTPLKPSQPTTNEQASVSRSNDKNENNEAGRKDKSDGLISVISATERKFSETKVVSLNKESFADKKTQGNSSISFEDNWAKADRISSGPEMSLKPIIDPNEFETGSEEYGDGSDNADNASGNKTTDEAAKNKEKNCQNGKQDIITLINEPGDPVEFGSGSENESERTSSWTCSKEADENVFSDELINESADESVNYSTRRPDIGESSDSKQGGIYEMDPNCRVDLIESKSDISLTEKDHNIVKDEGNKSVVDSDGENNQTLESNNGKNEQICSNTSGRPDPGASAFMTNNNDVPTATVEQILNGRRRVVEQGGTFDINCSPPNEILEEYINHVVTYNNSLEAEQLDGEWNTQLAIDSTTEKGGDIENSLIDVGIKNQPFGKMVNTKRDTVHPLTAEDLNFMDEAINDLKSATIKLSGIGELMPQAPSPATNEPTGITENELSLSRKRPQKSVIMLANKGSTPTPTLSENASFIRIKTHKETPDDENTSSIKGRDPSDICESEVSENYNKEPNIVPGSAPNIDLEIANHASEVESCIPLKEDSESNLDVTTNKVNWFVGEDLILRSVSKSSPDAKDSLEAATSTPVQIDSKHNNLRGPNASTEPETFPSINTKPEAKAIMDSSMFEHNPKDISSTSHSNHTDETVSAEANENVESLSEENGFPRKLSNKGEISYKNEDLPNICPQNGSNDENHSEFRGMQENSGDKTLEAKSGGDFRLSGVNEAYDSADAKANDIDENLCAERPEQVGSNIAEEESSEIRSLGPKSEEIEALEIAEKFINSVTYKHLDSPEETFGSIDVSDRDHILTHFINLEKEYGETDIPYRELEEPCIKKTISLTHLDSDENSPDEANKETSPFPWDNPSNTNDHVDSLVARTAKLQETDAIIQRMQQRRASETKPGLVDERLSQEASFGEPAIKSMKELQGNHGSEQEDDSVVVFRRLQSESTQESSPPSESVVFGGNQKGNDDGESSVGLAVVQRQHSIPRSNASILFKSVTIDDTVRYIEPPLESETSATSASSFCPDEDTSEDIRRKMLTYSLSGAYSKFLGAEASSASVSLDQSNISNDSNITTAVADLTATSTDTDSTTISAVTKLQAGARGFLTRRRLTRASIGTKSPAKENNKASLGNSAIGESLERLIQEAAVKKIQAAYRKHCRQKDIQSPKTDLKSAFQSQGSQLEPQALYGQESESRFSSFDSVLATRRHTLQRGDAMRNDSSQDDEPNRSNNADAGSNPFSAGTKKTSREESAASRYEESATDSCQKSSNKLNWLALRQNSMPVQIESEVFRVIPKHMRKRIKSADMGKQKRLRF